MKIVVCIKQVPDTKGGVKFKPDGTLDRAAMLTIMNPDDKAGLEKSPEPGFLRFCLFHKIFFSHFLFSFSIVCF